MKKRIGILTFHFSNHNYGALLQTYASVTLLSKLGYDSKVINLIPEEYQKKRSLMLIISDLILKNPFYVFRNKFIPLTKMIKSKKDLIELNNQFEIFFVGSDQVWRKGFAFENYFHYFLDFVNEDKMKISYAASFGEDHLDIDNDTRIHLKKLLDGFCSISVREDSGINICRNEFDIKAEKVLDPTLLLTVDDYNVIISSESHKRIKHSYIAYYQLTHTIGESNNALQISKWLNLPLENVYRQSIDFGIRTFTPFSSFSQWLFKIKQSDFVVTDSYHCMIFAIIYRKDFVVLGNDFGGNTRVTSLLESLDLKDRYLEKIDECLLLSLLPINYDEVYKKLVVLKLNSMTFLSKLTV